MGTAVLALLVALSSGLMFGVIVGGFKAATR